MMMMILCSLTRQSHGTLGVLNEWPTSRSTDSVGLAAAINKLEFTYAIQ